MKYLELIEEQIRGKKICMFPMGIAAKSTYQKLKNYGIEADFFSDSNPELWGTEFESKKCISKIQLSEMKQENLVVIVESLYYKEIKQDLQKNGIKNILRVYPEKFVTDKFVAEHKMDLDHCMNAVLDICADEKSKEVFKYLVNSWKMENCPDNYFECIYEKNQYFDPAIIMLHEDEVFVDGGAYIGDTGEEFLKFCNGKYEKMHLFELDPNIYEKLNLNLTNWGGRQTFCYPYGLSNENGKVSFSGGDSNSSINGSKETNTIGEVRKLDDILKDERVTFIKMDIEGSELAALKGASNIIKSQKPKLAICIYHSPQDMLNIPIYIKSLVPEYKIYIRHYTDMMLETVCYAIL